MIDLEAEHLVALRDLPSLLPRRRGRPLHLSTAYRWISRGARGAVLESVRLGGITYTSREALQRFARVASGVGPPVAGVNPRRHSRAESELDARGMR